MKQHAYVAQMLFSYLNYLPVLLHLVGPQKAVKDRSKEEKGKMAPLLASVIFHVELMV